MLDCPPGERRIATGQKLQMVEISALQAERAALLLQCDHRIGEELPAAFGAHRIAPDQENQDLSGLGLRWRNPFGVHGVILPATEKFINGKAREGGDRDRDRSACCRFACWGGLGGKGE